MAIKNFNQKNRKIIATAVAAVCTVMITWSAYKLTSDPVELIELQLSSDIDNTSDPVISPTPLLQAEAPELLSYTIEPGDNLGRVFDKLELPPATMYKLLDADLDFLQLDNLEPGQRLSFVREGKNKLVTRMEVEVDSINTLVFVRDGEEYNGEMKTYVTNIVKRHVQGEIVNSLYQSASRAGLTPTEIDTVSRLFEDKINFGRDFRAGDTFSILYDDIYVGDTHTDRSILKAVVFNNRGKQLAAYLNDDKLYYDETGQSLNRSFLHSPLQQSFRISSHFNPKRLHPVTRQISPHRGTDYATPIGTKALAISDGVVTRVGNHPAAGIHITVQHTEKYSTRYLHLNKALVKQGQRVSMGEVIAETGNTGRSTGPHLHFELHSGSVPVDFVAYSLPEGRQLNPDQMVTFRQLVADYTAKLMAPEETRQVASKARTSTAVNTN